MTASGQIAKTKSLFTRPTVRAAAIGCGALTVLGFAIGQAAAKSDVSVTAVLIPVHGLAHGLAHGSSPVRQIDVTGRGADDSARFQQLCVDRRIGTAGWRKIDCGPVGFGEGGTVHVVLPFAGPESESFRAGLLRVRSADGGSPVLDRVSRTVTVTPTDGEPPRLARLINRLLADRLRLR